MKDTLAPGLSFEFKFRVTEQKTVPCLYPESEEFREMPHVLATGYMVGLFEWACVRALKQYLDWPGEQTVGTHVSFSHVAATPPGLEVNVRGRLTRIEGRKLAFRIEADDGVERISEGTHERFVIYPAKFNEKVRRKLQHYVQRKTGPQGPA